LSDDDAPVVLRRTRPPAGPVDEGPQQMRRVGRVPVDRLRLRAWKGRQPAEDLAVVVDDIRFGNSSGSPGPQAEPDSPAPLRPPKRLARRRAEQDDPFRAGHDRPIRADAGVRAHGRHERVARGRTGVEADYAADGIPQEPVDWRSDAA